jgi:hypothetical protein
MTYRIGPKGEHVIAHNATHLAVHSREEVESGNQARWSLKGDFDFGHIHFAAFSPGGEHIVLDVSDADYVSNPQKIIVSQQSDGKWSVSLKKCFDRLSSAPVHFNENGRAFTLYRTGEHDSHYDFYTQR